MSGSFLLVVAFIFLFMTAIFCLALIKKDNSIVDIAWGLGFIGVAIFTFFLKEGWTSRHLIGTGLVLIWGMRLAIHIAIRNTGKGEDFRYAKWRPNYFGEVVLWWGIFLLALSMKNSWIAIFSPHLISVLILRVSGVTMLEKKYAGNAEFEAYAKRTNAFFPWFPTRFRKLLIHLIHF